VIKFTGGTGRIFIFKYSSAIIRLSIGFVFVLIAYFGIKSNIGVDVSNIFLTFGYLAVLLIPIGTIQIIGTVIQKKVLSKDA
jgi:hypothetical protein